MTRLTRRIFVTGAAAAPILAASIPTTRASQATRAHEGTGGLGLPREVFEQTYGAGTADGHVLVYPNPYREGSRLVVRYTDGVASFIQVTLVEENGVHPAQIESITAPLLPRDAASVGNAVFWLHGSVLPGVDVSLVNFPSMHMAGSGATYGLVAYQHPSTDGAAAGSILRANGITLSLAIPNGADQFAPASNGVGVGDTREQWDLIFGTPAPVDGGIDYAVDPWDEVFVRYTGDNGTSGLIVEVDAVSAAGVATDAAIGFADRILPQSAQRIAGFTSYATDQGAIGWGISTWHVGEDRVVFLFMSGTSDGSGNIAVVATA